MITTFHLSTQGQGLYEFTRDVATWVQGTGVLTLFVKHTSASLVIQENADPEVQVDLQNFFHRFVPPTTDPSMDYLTHTNKAALICPPTSRQLCYPLHCKFLW